MILSAISSLIYSLAPIISSKVVGFTTGLLVKRPLIRSFNFAITVPSSVTSSDTFIPLVVPQSFIVIVTSWLTSTKRRVKYPDSAVFKAVSVEPFLEPCDEMKNSDIVNPSRKHERIGISILSPFGLAIRPRIPDNCTKLPILPRAPESLIK